MLQTEQDFRSRVDQLTAIDRAVFGDKAWTADAFLRPFPMKWELSEIDGDPVNGYAVVSAAIPGWAHLNRIVVAPSLHGRGVGTMLMARAFVRARTAKLATMTLEHSGDLTAFYERFGFTVMGEAERTDYACRKAKTLDPAVVVMAKHL